MNQEETARRQAWEVFLPLVAVVGPPPGSGRANRVQPAQLDGQVAVVPSTLYIRPQERRVPAARATRAGILMEMALLRRRKLLAVVGDLAVPEATPQQVLEETGVQVSRVPSQEQQSTTQVAAGVESELPHLEALDLGSRVGAVAV